MKTPDFESVLERLRYHFCQSAEDLFDWEVRCLASPIEQVFLGAMLAGAWAPLQIIAGRLERDRAHDALEALGLSAPEKLQYGRPQRLFMNSSRESFVATQHSMALESRRIIPDFAFVHLGTEGAEAQTAAKVIVELDGHDFHERTPAQAQSDKSRDRELQTKGWHVMRFTGREVLRDPEQCLGEVHNLLFAKSALHRQKIAAESV